MYVLVIIQLRSPLKQNRRRAKLNTLGTQWARWDAVRNKLMVMAKENLAEAIVFIAFPNKKQNSYYIEQYGSLTEKLLLSESGKKLIREWYKLDPRSYHQGKQGICCNIIVILLSLFYWLH